MIYRVECNALTGDVITIYQTAYKKGEDVIVLDVGIEPPEGFMPIEEDNKDAQPN